MAHLQWLGIPMRDGECAESIAVKPPRGRDLRKLESLRPHHPASCRGPPGSHARPWRGFPALLLHGLRAEHVSLLWVWLRAAGLHATIPGPETLRNDAALSDSGGAQFVLLSMCSSSVSISSKAGANSEQPASSKMSSSHRNALWASRKSFTG